MKEEIMEATERTAINKKSGYWSLGRWLKKSLMEKANYWSLGRCLKKSLIEKSSRWSLGRWKNLVTGH
jgi:hypothetical protein